MGGERARRSQPGPEEFTASAGPHTAWAPDPHSLSGPGIPQAAKEASSPALPESLGLEPAAQSIQEQGRQRQQTTQQTNTANEVPGLGVHPATNQR